MTLFDEYVLCNKCGANLKLGYVEKDYIETSDGGYRCKDCVKKMKELAKGATKEIT